MEVLREFYSDTGPERVGLILNDGQVIELANTSPTPDEASLIDPMDLIFYEDTAVATWHTHPRQVSNLSVDDFFAFKNWPQLKHYIVGADGVRCFRVERGRVLND